ncbi:uncharacterized protein TNCV_4945391 [Trichonephila clavipes]|nr:uncharacterized protein TNCV_4945391 [Trichonephila clavipes]
MDEKLTNQFIHQEIERKLAQVVTPKCLGGPPVNRDRRHAHPGFMILQNTPVGSAKPIIIYCFSLQNCATAHKPAIISSVNQTKKYDTEGRKVRSGYLPFRTNASTLPITLKRSSSRDVGTSSYRYHTATYSPVSVSANR